MPIYSVMWQNRLHEGRIVNERHYQLALDEAKKLFGSYKSDRGKVMNRNVDVVLTASARAGYTASEHLAPKEGRPRIE